MQTDQPASHPLLARLFLTLLCAVLALLLAGYAYLILQWPMMREAHYLHYIGYLINEHNFVPYRDIYETSWFGTFLFHMLVGKLFGYTAFQFRLADITFLCLLLIVTWSVLRRLDTLMASVATLSFGLAYLHYGPANTLQRDYIMLLPISTALLATLQIQWSVSCRALCVGLCFGLAISVKPHVIIGLLPVLWLLHSLTPASEKSFLKILLLTVLATTITFSAGLIWLWWRGGLQDFLDMTFQYLPLYQDLNGAHEMTTPDARLQNTLRWWKAFTWIWPSIATAGLVRAWAVTARHSVQRALILTLAALMICFNLYPLPAGKFWDYHWIPFTYFAMLCSSLLLMPATTKNWWSHAITLGCLFYFLQNINSQYMPWFRLHEQIDRYPDISINTKPQDDLAAFIQQHLQAGDTIQTIDQGGPSTDILLRARAVLATRYVGSFVFLHHISNPHVQAMQKDFLDKLHAAPPKLFMVMTDFTRPAGVDTRKDIPGLQEFLSSNYVPILEQPGFVMWERSNSVMVH